MSPYNRVEEGWKNSAKKENLKEVINARLSLMSSSDFVDCKLNDKWLLKNN